MKPGAWLTLTEIDDLFGHEPMAPESRRILSDFAEKMCNADAYYFHMGRKLREHMQRAGFIE